MHVKPFGWGCDLYTEEQVNEFLKVRNQKNTVIDEYNCGGYALNTFTWYQPAPDMNEYYHWLDLDDVKSMVNWMVQELPFIRLIHSLAEVRENEYPVLFRTDGGDDFHFVKRCNDGVWRHKPGAWPIEVISEDEVFSPIWWNRYDGEIFMFACSRQVGA